MKSHDSLLRDRRAWGVIASLHHSYLYGAFPAALRQIKRRPRLKKKNVW